MLRRSHVPVVYACTFLAILSSVYAALVLSALYFHADQESQQPVLIQLDPAKHMVTDYAPGPTEKSVVCETSKGTIRIELDRESAPLGVQQLVAMVKDNFLEDVAFFRVNADITQFGVRERVFKFSFNKQWERDLNPLPRQEREPWKRGTVAMIGGTQMVIVKRDSSVMGRNNHDTIVGRINEDGMKVIDQLHMYPDHIDHPRGPRGPDQTDVYQHGWKYLNENFPLTDRIVRCNVV